MQSVRVMMVAAWAVLIVPLLANRADAHLGFGVPAGTATAQCVVGCNMQKKGCFQTARTTALACRQNCRMSSTPTAIGSCMRGCVSTFISSVFTCHTDQQTCLEGCFPSGPPSTPGPRPTPGPPPTPGPGGNCLGTCGMDLAGCAQGVVSQAKTCLAGCRTATDRLACLMGCATSAKSGADTCATDFQSCRSDCPAP